VSICHDPRTFAANVDLSTAFFHNGRAVKKRCKKNVKNAEYLRKRVMTITFFRRALLP
jgi:hypothetical protein